MQASVNEQTTKLFREALHTFVTKIQQDEQVIAAILLGSLSYDQVWEKSDIDIKLIVHDQKLKTGYACFVENDVPINTSIQTRDDFKRWVERSVQSSVSHSLLVRSTLLFTKDASITDYYEQIRYIGKRDRQLQLMSIGSYTLSLLAKAEKWLYIKNDYTYSAFWVIKLVDLLSQIEVILNEDIPMREAVQQAISYNPEFFHAVYTEMILEEVKEPKVKAVLELINDYLNVRAEQLFQPILAYLKEEGEIRTVTDIVEKFSLVIDIDTSSAATGCDWLAERGLLAKLEAETKATPKSRVQLTEPAYLFEQSDSMQWEG